MKYFIRNRTLFIRGFFRAASTGFGGGIGEVSTILNHTSPADKDPGEYGRELELIISGQGLPPDYFGLLTEVKMEHLCIFQYDFLSVFISAGMTGGEDPGPGSINIIAVSSQGMTDAALLEAILTATGAKAGSLSDMNYPAWGSPADAVIVASEGPAFHQSAGRASELGLRLHAAVIRGIPEALLRSGGSKPGKGPSFFVFSRYGGDHWVEWLPENCPYYPCHFDGQRCDFCYCPFYPCCDDTLGQWVQSSHKGEVWNCSRCTLLHQPEITDYLRKHPEASLAELRSRAERKERVGSPP